jgi:hypothetical protein
MWNWSKTVAERAAAAAWQSWRTREPRPTVTDPPIWDETAEQTEVDSATDYRLIG